MSYQTVCSPSGLNGSALCSDSVEPGPRVCASNLDLNGKLIKKGLTVSHHGIRALVTRVSRGSCCCDYLHFSGRPTGSFEWLSCASVQVVK